MMGKPIPIDEEYLFDGRAIVSETDLHGVITFANRKFCEISGYSVDELIGQPHNIIRHPDMPKAAFALMWKTVQSGTLWHGLVKNLRKDGCLVPKNYRTRTIRGNECYFIIINTNL